MCSVNLLNLVLILFFFLLPPILVLRFSGVTVVELISSPPPTPNENFQTYWVKMHNISNQNIPLDDFSSKENYEDEKKLLNKNESLGDCTYLTKEELPVNSNPILEKEASLLSAAEVVSPSHIPPSLTFNQESHLELELHVLPIPFEILKEFECVMYEEDENSIIRELLDNLGHDEKESFERSEEISNEEPFFENKDQIDRFLQIQSNAFDIEQNSGFNDNVSNDFVLVQGKGNDTSLDPNMDPILLIEP